MINAYNRPKCNTFDNFIKDKTKAVCAYELAEEDEDIGKYYCCCYKFQCRRICVHVEAIKYIRAKENNELILPIKAGKRGRRGQNAPALVNDNANPPKRFHAQY